MTWIARLTTQRNSLNLDVSLHVGAPVCALIGPNGAGKTSLLLSMVGALRPDHGHIEVQGRRWLDTTQGVDMPPEQRRVAWVPQGGHLFEQLSVLDNVGFGLRAHERSVKMRRAQAHALLERLGQADLSGARDLSALSGGQRAQVALARALMVPSALLVLDEPFSAMDVQARARARLHVHQLCQERSTSILMVTHDPRDFHGMAPHLVVLKNGRVSRQGEWDGVPQDEFERAFFTS